MRYYIMFEQEDFDSLHKACKPVKDEKHFAVKILGRKGT